ncbi:hypothetical protein N752_20810 [Desulforamulus aquiferis]|nr:hypothetical protein [Desulforamulus aquiferis]RYD03276.1 hypothetical protein N752_20810 [Desulforamulus aquiferis]
MTWEEVKKTYPNQWLLIEAIEAHTEENKRIVNQIAVINIFAMIITKHCSNIYNYIGNIEKENCMLCIHHDLN